MPEVIDGKTIAQTIRAEIALEVAKYKDSVRRPPGLGVILVGDNPASETYVSNKEKAALGCGFETFDARLPVTASQEEVHDAIKAFNENEKIDGILLQLPLPKHLHSQPLIASIDIHKDADGLHPINQGLLMQSRAVLKPCTPWGVIELLKRSKISIEGKNAAVIGRSILVGKPAAMLLLEENATVTIAHSKTRDIQKVVGDADIVVAAVGIPRFVKGAWIKEGAAVIDVGINRLENGKLAGDVEYEEAAKKASYITPVPGGVGPMTIAMLLSNTLTAYKKRKGL